LKDSRKYLHVARALLNSMEQNVRDDPNNIWKFSGYQVYIRKYNQLARAVIDHVGKIPIIDLFNEDKIKGPMDTTVIQQKFYFDMAHANVSILVAFLEDKLNFRKDEISNMRNFFHSNLRKAIAQKPKNEKEIQNVMEHLLIGRGLQKGIDYDRETGRVKASGKESVPDFIFPKFNLALEVKLVKDERKRKTIVDEISADIVAYSKKYSSIIFVIYDLGFIRDDVEFKKDIESQDGVDVIIVKH